MASVPLFDWTPDCFCFISSSPSLWSFWESEKPTASFSSDSLVSILLELLLSSSFPWASLWISKSFTASGPSAVLRLSRAVCLKRKILSCEKICRPFPPFRSSLFSLNCLATLCWTYCSRGSVIASPLLLKLSRSLRFSSKVRFTTHIKPTLSNNLIFHSESLFAFLRVRWFFTQVTVSCGIFRFSTRCDASKNTA